MTETHQCITIGQCIEIPQGIKVGFTPLYKDLDFVYGKLFCLNLGSNSNLWAEVKGWGEEEVPSSGFEPRGWRQKYFGLSSGCFSTCADISLGLRII